MGEGPACAGGLTNEVVFQPPGKAVYLNVELLVVIAVMTGSRSPIGERLLL